MVRVGYKIGDQVFVIQQIQSLYGHPHKAFREYISNSVDNREGANVENIEIIINKPQQQIIIQDDGAGMDVEELRRIPASIGLSSKKGIETARGEKGFGMLAYPSCGARECIVYSRNVNSHGTLTGRLMMREDRSWADVDQIDYKNLPFEPFNIGTRVILGGISERTFKHYFNLSQIKNMISETFSPLLRKGVIEVKIRQAGKRKYSPQIVDPLEYNGKLVLDDTASLSYRKDKQNKEGHIDFYLFINPEGRNEKVRHYNKGVKVLDSVSVLDELSNLPWASGKLTGEIDEDFLTLNPERDAINREGGRNAKRYIFFVDTLKSLEDKLRGEVERHKTIARRTKLEKFAYEFVRNLDYVYREMKGKMPVLVLGKEGDEVKKVRLDKSKDKGSTRMGGERDGESSNIGREVVIEDERGEERPVRRARRILSSAYEFDFVDFETKQQSLRSELDEIYSRIRINTSHPEYKQTSESGDEKVLNRYISLLISKEIACAEFRRLCKEGLINPVENVHFLSEIFAEFYQRGIILAKIV